MSEFFAVRNIDTATRQFVVQYAKERDVTMSEALREIVFLAKAHIKEQKSKVIKKRKTSIFKVYQKIAFRSKDPNLSKNIDKYLYGKRD